MNHRGQTAFCIGCGARVAAAAGQPIDPALLRMFEDAHRPHLPDPPKKD